ncbi:MAG TPA: helix-turn-helix domain-containing protein [Dehalococcoidia bacterium]|nr:helix-turn-helix domain-containing protein [Dehalococcoidia bacterium]
MAVNRDSDALDFDDLISVREAAKLLRISESTVWRWIESGRLKAYKLGPKRVCLRRTELRPVLISIEPSGLVPPNDLSQYMFPMNPDKDPNLTDEEVIARASALRKQLLAERGGIPFPPSWIEINEAREERSEEL